MIEKNKDFTFETVLSTEVDKALTSESSFSAREASSTARICIQIKAALAAPLIATVATGIPVGI